MISSAVYCLNDIRDVEVDRLHPVKRRRPVASGRVPVSVALRDDDADDSSFSCREPVLSQRGSYDCECGNIGLFPHERCLLFLP